MALKSRESIVGIWRNLDFWSWPRVPRKASRTSTPASRRVQAEFGLFKKKIFFFTPYSLKMIEIIKRVDAGAAEAVQNP